MTQAGVRDKTPQRSRAGAPGARSGALVPVLPPPRRRPSGTLARNCPAPGRAPAPPKALSLEEARAVVQAADAGRDRLLVETLLKTGGRVSEVLALRRCDLAPTSVQLPNRKQRRSERASKTVFVPAELAARLLYWCQQEGIGDLDPVFRSRQGGGALSRKRAWAIVRAAARRAGVFRERAGRLVPAWPHTLRHTAGTTLYRQTRDLPLVMAQLGHASPRQAMTYQAMVDPERERTIQQIEW